MSIKHALLALLTAEPAHGYELKKQVEGTLAPLWTLREAQIYNNLRILAQGGLIELDERVQQVNLPDRKTYRLTSAGEVELASWIGSPVRSSRQLKDDFYLKLVVLARILEKQDSLSELLWRQRAVYLQHLRELEQALAEAETGGDAVTATLLDGAILHTEADLGWLDRCEERLLGRSSGKGGAQ